MRPISIRFKAFGPFVKEQLIEFSELERIFAICGETGAGKTTILDAMCYALYGSSSSGSRGEFSDMRCQQAGDGDDTEVEFVFEENGRVYRFRRTYAMARSRFNETYSCEERVEGGYRPLAANIKKSTMQEMAESILHLNANQFRQIIILPQGKFESFLVSDSRAKEEVLESIFNAYQWGDIAKRVTDSLAKEQSALLAKEIHLREILNKYGCATEEEMQDRESEKAGELADREKEYEQAEKDKITVQGELEAAQRDESLFSDLDILKTNLENLEKQRENRQEDEKKVSLAGEAQKICSEYDRFSAAKTSAESERNRLVTAETRRITAESGLTAAREEKKQHLAGEAEQDARKTRRSRLEIARPAYTTIEDYRTKHTQADSKYSEADKDAEDYRKLSEEAAEKRDRALAEYETIHQDYTEALRKYRAGFAGELAAQLQEDTPCPVCGSLHHPAPAVCSEDHVSRKDLDAIEETLKDKEKKWKSAEKTMESSSRTLEEKKKAAETAKGELTRAEAELKAAEKNLLEGIADSGELEKAITDLTVEISSYDTRAAEIDEKLRTAGEENKSADDAFKETEKNLEDAEKMLASAEENWKKALAGSAFESEEEFLQCRMDTEQVIELTRQLAEFKTNLENIQKQISEKEALCSGREKPDVAGIRNKQNDLNKKANELYADCNSMRTYLAGLKTDLEEYSSTHPVLINERAELEKNILFAERLRGEKGVSIKRYVLGIMMTMIVRQANTFLANIYGGRYRLHREESDAKNKKVGLDLEVEDLQTGESRGVGSLSGGEKFLVALSLAIGLSTVVQLQGKGVHMDAMFVDEGFGSLHANAVEDAITILAQARGGNGVVGVITHVEQVVKSIGGGLEAVKDSNGNSIRYMTDVSI